jgi:hypothetical protein
MAIAPRITKRNGEDVTIEVTCKLSGSMLEMEEQIQECVNAIGNTLSEDALKRFDADGENLTIGGTTWYSKGQLSKTYHTPYGTTTISRYVYQRAEGGTTLCPLDEGARIIKKSTPRFAMMLAHKFANNAAAQVLDDLEQNHKRPCVKATLQDLVADVATIAQEKEGTWEYEPPAEMEGKVETVGIGVDGTCMLLCDKQWREAMTGTISLYDQDGERQHTIYVGAAPEYGKQTFYERMTREIFKVKRLYPEARYAGIADGATSNWKFLDPFIDIQILDFYHVSQYLTDAAPTMGKNEEASKKWLEEACHNLKHDSGAAKRILDDLRQTMALSKSMNEAAKKGLEACVTYFGNHLHQMDYAGYRSQGYPIGSGVTEAACKTLVKQRLCCSGMRWTPEGAQNVLSLRALVKTKDRWTQFWQKISQFGVPKFNMA